MLHRKTGNKNINFNLLGKFNLCRQVQQIYSIQQLDRIEERNFHQFLCFLEKNPIDFVPQVWAELNLEEKQLFIKSFSFKILKRGKKIIPAKLSSHFSALLEGEINFRKAKSLEAFSFSQTHGKWLNFPTLNNQEYPYEINCLTNLLVFSIPQEIYEKFFKFHVQVKQLSVLRSLREVMPFGTFSEKETQNIYSHMSEIHLVRKEKIQNISNNKTFIVISGQMEIRKTELKQNLQANIYMKPKVNVKEVKIIKIGQKQILSMNSSQNYATCLSESALILQIPQLILKELMLCPNQKNFFDQFCRKTTNLHNRLSTKSQKAMKKSMYIIKKGLRNLKKERKSESIRQRVESLGLIQHFSESQLKQKGFTSFKKERKSESMLTKCKPSHPVLSPKISSLIKRIEDKNESEEEKQTPPKTPKRLFKPKFIRPLKPFVRENVNNIAILRKKAKNRLKQYLGYESVSQSFDYM